MPSTTSATDPLPYYEVLSTFWAAARTARGTDLRGQSLVNFDVFGSVPYGFVAELGSKLRPARIEHGLGEAGSRQCTRIDIADADAPVLPHDSCGEPMQKMLATARDLGLDRPYAGFAPSTLCNGKRPLVLAVETWRLDLLACGERRQRLETEVDTDLTGPMRPVFRDLDLQIEVPPATGILREAATADFPIDRTAEPKPVAAPEEDGTVPFHTDRTRRLEGNPTQGLSAAPSRPPAACISRKGKLLADRLHGVLGAPWHLR